MTLFSAKIQNALFYSSHQWFCFFYFQVRTKDKEFESVSHLIDYHRNNNLPIISGGSAVYLQHPVLNAQAAGQHYN